MEDKIAEMIAVSLKDLDYILVEWVRKLAAAGWNAEEIIEALKFMGYAWC